MSEYISPVKAQLNLHSYFPKIFTKWENYSALETGWTTWGFWQIHIYADVFFKTRAGPPKQVHMGPLSLQEKEWSSSPGSHIWESVALCGFRSEEGTSKFSSRDAESGEKHYPYNKKNAKQIAKQWYFMNPSENWGQPTTPNLERHRCIQGERVCLLGAYTAGFFLFCFVLFFGFLFCFGEVFGFFVFLCFFFLFRVTPTAYGCSQARCLNRAMASSHSHSNAGCKPRLRPTPQLTATPDT